MRGYFAIGIEGVSKPMNVGSLFRTAHAFGASFVFTVAADYSRVHCAKSDTSDTPGHLPFYGFPDVSSMILPVVVQFDFNKSTANPPDDIRVKFISFVTGLNQFTAWPAGDAKAPMP